MAEQQIANLGRGAAPLTRVTKDSEQFELLAVNATFDGSAAAAAFLPCVEVVSDAGIVVGRHVGQESVAAGGSAEVTFAPFLGGSSVAIPIPPTQLSVLGCRAKYYTGIVPSNFTVPDSTFTAITYNQNRFDTGNFHPITTDTNLTGTVSKTASSTTITGVGTSFNTELRVGDPVKIPGGVVIYYPDVVVVKSITSATSFEAYFPPSQTAAGQTATKDSSVFVAQLAGYYSIDCNTFYRGNDAGIRELNIIIDGIDPGALTPGSNTHQEGQAFVKPAPSPGETAFTVTSGTILFQKGEFWQIFAFQNSGAPLNMAVDLVGLTASCAFMGI